MLVASRLSPEKGIGDAIEAAHAAGAPLKVAGDGPDAQRLGALAAGWARTWSSWAGWSRRGCGSCWPGRPRC